MIRDERGRRVRTNPIARATAARIATLTPRQCQRLLTRLRDPDILRDGSAGGLQRLVLVSYRAHYLSDAAIEAAWQEDSRA